MHDVARWCVLALLLMAGCASSGASLEQYAKDRELFGAVIMRIHPIFTQAKDWTGDGRPDGIEAEIELQDRFGDPTKATGKIVFELYNYRQAAPDPRGERVENPWIGSLLTLEDQHLRWNRTSRTYSFQLAYPKIRNDRTYVLTATFERPAGGRLFDRTILEPQVQEATGVQSTAEPGFGPTTRAAQP